MFRTSLIGRAGAVALASSAAVIACAVPSLAGTGAPASTPASQISLAPAHTTPGVPQSRAYFIRTVRAGGSFTDAVLVHNTGSSPATLDVLPSDGVTAQSTGAVYASGTATRDGRWLGVATRTITVPAHHTLSVPFTVHVPMGARAGQHLAGLAFVNGAPAVTQRGALSIRTFFRTVMGVLVTVPGAAKPDVAFSRVTIAPGGFTGLATVDVGFRNTGNLLVRPTLTVLLTRGRYHRQVVKQLNTVLPTDTVGYAVSWPTALAGGTYDVAAWLSATGMRTVEYRTSVATGQDLAGGPNAPLRPFLLPTAQTHHSLSAGLLACTGAAALLAAVGTWWVVVVRRRRRAAADDPRLDEATPGVDDRQLVGTP